MSIGLLITNHQLDNGTINVKTSTGITLSSQQQELVSSVLELFSGGATKAKLQLWKDDAEFEDPLCIARGRTQFEAQWVS
jgi:hypothetical protein